MAAATFYPGARNAGGLGRISGTMQAMDLPGRTISAFVDVVTDRRSGLISPQRTGGALHVSLSHLAWVVQLDRDTLIQ